MALLLVGRTGNGKSSTGNTIVREKAFTPRGSTAAVIAEISNKEADINGQKITVVDGPGIGDASFDNYNDLNSTLDQVKKALDLCPNGFSALLIVLKYGIGFTKQEKDTITMIKAIFGPDVVRKYGVIVMSHGDSFEMDTKDEEMSFEDWCKEQTGDVKALFTECDNRCVLFNNREKDLEKQKAQLDSLMSKVSSICSQSKNYTLEHYKEAERERTKLLVRSKLPQMEEKIEKGLDEINEKLNQVGNDNSEASVVVLNDCIAKINDLKSYLQKEDENTGCTKDLQMKIQVVETTVQMKLRRIQAQRPEDDEMVNSQSGGSGILSSLSEAVSRAVDTVRPYFHFAIDYVTEEAPDNALICDDQSAVSKDQQQEEQTKEETG